MLRRLAPAAALALLPLPALAHGGMWVGPEEVWHAWTLDPWVIVPLALAWWLYGRGLARLWGKAGTGRGVTPWRAGCFALGMASLVLSLVWPLDAMGETLFSAHMAQHMVLLVLAPPLLVLGTPLAPWAAALPRPWHRPLARALRAGMLRGPAALLARPWAGCLATAVVLWGWHAPAAFDAALADPALHALEHACFLAVGLGFWWGILNPARGDPLAPLSGAGAALVTLIHSGLLGALISLAPVGLYDGYAGRGAPWGLGQLEDQQLAGLVMWVPGGFAYLGAGLWLLAAWLNGGSRASTADAGG